MLYLPRLSFALILSSMLSTFVLSADVLNLFGYNFALPGGSFIFKIHPSFYLLFLGYASILIYEGGWKFVHDALLKRRNFFLLLACVCCFCYQVLFLKHPMAPFIVTWLYPVLVFCLFDKFTIEQKQLIYNLLLFVITCNAILGIFEYMRGDYLLPKLYFSMETEELLDFTEWGFSRASGLYGHALIATLVSATVVVGLYAKSLYHMLSKYELICFCCSVISLPAFGGRTSIAVALLMMLLISSLKFYHSLRGRHIPRLKVILIFTGVLLLPFFIITLFELGLFDTLLARIDDDNGSAESRITALLILFDTSFLEVLLGDFNNQLFNRQLLYGTQYGIEIFWVAILLQSGLIVSLMMVYILSVFHRYLFEKIGHYSLWTSATFLLAISSGTGLASKTLMLAHFLILSLFLLVPTGLCQREEEGAIYANSTE